MILLNKAKLIENLFVKQVTIFGESAGSISVHFHQLSPASKGLFQRAIGQSALITTSFLSNDKNPAYYARYILAET